MIYYHEDERHELYNLASDQSESNNVAKANPEISKRLPISVPI